MMFTSTGAALINLNILSYVSSTCPGFSGLRHNEPLAG
jgi:hypothetical protein